MSSYAFRAVDVAGIPSRGEIEADSKAQVSEMLRQKGLIVLDVTEEREAMKIEGIFDRFRHVGMRELAIVSRQFATLIGSGMPMLRSLYTLEDQTEDETIKSALGGLRQDVEAGSSLADAMERRPDVFNTLFRVNGPLRRELGTPRGGAGARRVPLREARRPAAPDPLGDDVPDVRDGPGVR